MGVARSNRVSLKLACSKMNRLYFLTQYNNPGNFTDTIRNEVSAPTGENVHGLHAAANEGAAEEANRTFATVAANRVSRKLRFIK